MFLYSYLIMMKNKALILTGIGIGSALTIGAISMSFANDVETTTTDASATRPQMMRSFGGMEEKGMFGRGGQEGGKMFHMEFGGPMAENTDAQAAIENNDYAAFQSAIADSPMADKLTEERFAEIVERHNKQKTIETALENNDYEAFVSATTPTRDEFTQMVEMHAQHKAVQAAIEAKDYTAFQSAVANTPMADITEEQFTKMANHEKGEMNFKGKMGRNNQ